MDENMISFVLDMEKVNCMDSNIITLKHIMNLAFSQLENSVKKCMENHFECKERASILLNFIANFLKRCHFRRSLCQEDEGPFPFYADLVSGIVSFYLELFLFIHRGEEVPKEDRRKLCYFVKQVLADSGEKALDAVLQTSVPDGGDVSLLVPLVRYLLRKPPADSSPSHYLRYILTLAKWRRHTSDLDDLVKASQMIRAPKHFVDWAIKWEPQLKKEFPEDNRFKRRLITLFLLDAGLETHELLLEGLASYSAQSSEVTHGETKKISKKKKKKKAEPTGNTAENGGEPDLDPSAIDAGDGNLRQVFSHDQDLKDVSQVAEHDLPQSAEGQRKRKKKCPEIFEVETFDFSGSTNAAFVIDRGMDSANVNDNIEVPKKKKKKKDNISAEENATGIDDQTTGIDDLQKLKRLNAKKSKRNKKLAVNTNQGGTKLPTEEVEAENFDLSSAKETFVIDRSMNVNETNSTSDMGKKRKRKEFPEDDKPGADEPQPATLSNPKTATECMTSTDKEQSIVETKIIQTELAQNGNLDKLDGENGAPKLADESPLCVKTVAEDSASSFTITIDRGNAVASDASKLGSPTLGKKKSAVSDGSKSNTPSVVKDKSAVSDRSQSSTPSLVKDKSAASDSSRSGTPSPVKKKSAVSDSSWSDTPSLAQDKSAVTSDSSRSGSRSPVKKKAALGEKKSVIDTTPKEVLNVEIIKLYESDDLENGFTDSDIKRNEKTQDKEENEGVCLKKKSEYEQEAEEISFSSSSYNAQEGCLVRSDQNNEKELLRTLQKPQPESSIPNGFLDVCSLSDRELSEAQLASDSLSSPSCARVKLYRKKPRQKQKEASQQKDLMPLNEAVSVPEEQDSEAAEGIPAASFTILSVQKKPGVKRDRSLHKASLRSSHEASPGQIDSTCLGALVASLSGVRVAESPTESGEPSSSSDRRKGKKRNVGSHPTTEQARAEGSSLTEGRADCRLQETVLTQHSPRSSDQAAKPDSTTEVERAVKKAKDLEPKPTASRKATPVSKRTRLRTSAVGFTPAAAESVETSTTKRKVAPKRGHAAMEDSMCADAPGKSPPELPSCSKGSPLPTKEASGHKGYNLRRRESLVPRQSTQ